MHTQHSSLFSQNKSQMRQNNKLAASLLRRLLGLLPGEQTQASSHSITGCFTKSYLIPSNRFRQYDSRGDRRRHAADRLQPVGQNQGDRDVRPAWQPGSGSVVCTWHAGGGRRLWHTHRSSTYYIHVYPSELLIKHFAERYNFKNSFHLHRLT